MDPPSQDLPPHWEAALKVESTMRTGYEHGFRVITLTDCVAATSQEEQDNAIAYNFSMFSLPMASVDVIAAL